MGGGKSWAMRRKFVLLALKYPGLKILLLRRTFRELEETHIIPLKQELYGIAKYNETRKDFTFPNGSRIVCGYCDKEDDVNQYMSQEYDVIGLEEATQFTEFQQQSLALRNRSTRTDFKPRMYYTCNPGGVGHQWVKRLFIDRDYRNNEKAEDYVFIPARVYDNLELMKANPDYIDNLSNLPEDRKKAYLDGDWDALIGQFFTEWNRRKHVCEPFPIPRNWRKFRSMDWGFNDPCCVLWFAVDPDSRIFVYSEIYRNRTYANDMAKLVKDRTREDKISYTVASPDMWAKRGGILRADGGVLGESIADIFIKGGVPLRPADNSRVVGWQRVREYLRDAPDGLPYLQIFSTCENLIRTLPILQIDKNDTEDVADGEDHAAEALRYGLMSRPSANRETEKPKRKKRQFDPLNMGKPTRKSGFLGM
jgi:phage terminase large subunit